MNSIVLIRFKSILHCLVPGLLVIALVCISTNVLAQGIVAPAKPVDAAKKKKEDRRFRGMVALGFNAAQIDGDRMAGYYTFGVNAGVGSFAMITKKLSISAEIGYSMKGGKSTLANSKISTRNIVLDYVEIPIMFNYHDPRIAIFGGGFTIGGLVRNKQTIYDSFGNQTNTLTYKDSQNNDRSIQIDDAYLNLYRKYELGATAHVTFLIKNIIGIQCKFQYSIIPIAKVPDGNLKNGAQRNNVLTLRAMYLF